MPKFRKKPVVIEAFRLGYDPLPDWFMSAVSAGTAVLNSSSHPLDDSPVHSATIRTLEGDMTALAGEFVIQGVKGELYPCKPDIFAATYEPVID